AGGAGGGGGGGGCGRAAPAAWTVTTPRGVIRVDRRFRVLICAVVVLAGAGTALLARGLQRTGPPRPVAGAVAEPPGAWGSAGPVEPWRGRAARRRRGRALGRAGAGRLGIPAIGAHTPGGAGRARPRGQGRGPAARPGCPRRLVPVPGEPG